MTPFQRLIGAFVLVAVGCGQHDGPEIQVCDPDWLSSIEEAEFDAELWRNDASARPAMMASLDKEEVLVGRRPDEIIELLGPQDCYVHQDGDPCYSLDVDTRQTLAFHVAKSGRRKGLVTGVYATPDPGSLYGCP